MTTLSQAPLVEVYFEFRWGKVNEGPPGTRWTTPKEDVEFFPGQFRKVANDAGYTVLEETNPGLPVLPFNPGYNFRKATGQWPVIQIGPGVFRVSQLNQDYDWEPFLVIALDALHLLADGHPLGLSRLPAIGIELTYTDALALSEDESVLEFIRSRLQFELGLPKPLIDSRQTTAHATSLSLAVELRAVSPQGLLILEFNTGLVNGRRSLILHTRVRSTGPDCPTITLDSLTPWLNSAHELQRTTFRSLIHPAVLETFR